MIMKIEGTELEYTEADAIALEFYLGGEGEGLEAWGKRVWDNCKLYKENDGKDLSGNKLPKVFANSAQDLWKNKIIQRRKAIARDLLGEKTAALNPIETELPEHLDDACMQRCKEHANYMKRNDRYAKDKAEEKLKENKILADRAAKVEKLREKFDDETISIIYPQGRDLL